MEKITDKIDQFLPYGESLRSVLQHPSIKNKERRELLRLKGVFCNNTDEDTAFPILLTSLLSPTQFEYVKERLQVKEDRDKTLSRTFFWESEVALIEAIPDKFNIQEVITTNFPRYKLNGNPNFRMIDENPDKVVLDFKCETENYSKAWYRGKSEFKGQISLEKVVTKDKKVQLQLTYTSPETMDIAKKVSKKLEKTFKDNGHTDPNKKAIRILFKDFSNEERIKFFLSMTEGNNIFEFSKATFLDIGPDRSEDLPGNINWLDLAKVNELNINGEVLHKIHFIKDKKLHKYMEIAEMEVIYDFSIPSAEGKCRILFGFPNYFTKRLGNIEFVVDIIKIIPKEEYKTISQATLRTQLLKEFEKYKTEKFESSKI